VDNWYVIELIVTISIVILIYGAGFGSGYYYKGWMNGDAIITNVPASDPQSLEPLLSSPSTGDRNLGISGISVLLIWLASHLVWLIVACILLVLTYNLFHSTNARDISHLLTMVRRNRWMLICLFATILLISLAIPPTRTQIVQLVANLLVAITPWFAIYRLWIVIILSAIVFIVVGRVIFSFLTRLIVVSPEISQHSTIRGPALVLKPEHRDFLHWEAGKAIEKLDLGGNQKKLAGRIRDTRGIRYVVTAYGRFGGTSLVRGAINKLIESKDRQLIFYFEKTDSASGNNERSTRYSLKYEEAIRNKEVTFDGLLIGELEIRNAGDRESECIFKCKCQKLPPQLRNLFAYKSGKEDLENVFDFRMLIGGFQRLSSEVELKDRLLTRVHQYIGRKRQSSGTVVIIDKISRLEVLEALYERHLFKNGSLTFITLSRKEDVDQWQNYAQRLTRMGFVERPISGSTSSSTTDGIERLIEEIMEGLFEQLEVNSDEVRQTYKELRKHLEFVGKGAVGNVIETLKKGPYLEPDEQGIQYYIPLNQLPNRQEIQHNARLQCILDCHMSHICPEKIFFKANRIKRARHGIYLILEFMCSRDTAGKTWTFSTDELLEEVSQRPLIWNDPDLSLEIVWNLTEVLRRSGDLKPVGSHSFCIIWSGNIEIPEIKLINKQIPPEWREKFKIFEKRKKKPTPDFMPDTSDDIEKQDGVSNPGPSKGQNDVEVQESKTENNFQPKVSEQDYVGRIKREFDNTIVEVLVNVLVRTKVTLAGLMDLLFLALWLVSTYGFSRYVLPLLQQTGTMDQWMFNLMQVVFNVGTLVAVLQFVVPDILILIGRTYKQIREINKEPPGANETHDA